MKSQTYGLKCCCPGIPASSARLARSGRGDVRVVGRFAVGHGGYLFTNDFQISERQRLDGMCQCRDGREVGRMVSLWTVDEKKLELCECQRKVMACPTETLSPF